MSKPINCVQTAPEVTGTAADIVSESWAGGRDVLIQNNDSAGIVYLNFSGDATVSGSMIKLSPDESISATNVVNAISAIGSIASNTNVAVLVGM